MSRRARSAMYVSQPPRSGRTLSWQKAMFMGPPSPIHCSGGCLPRTPLPVVIAIAPALEQHEPAQQPAPPGARVGSQVSAPECEAVAAIDPVDLRRVQQLRQVLHDPPGPG